MVNHLLVNLVDSVLGKGKPTSGDNYSYHCPFCHHRKPKLEINFSQNENGTNHYQCWVCGQKGRSLHTLFKKVNAPQHRVEELKTYVKVNFGTESKKEEQLALPKEYKPLFNASTKEVIVRQSLRYLKERGLTNLDILRYQIGYCERGPYANMVIIPSFTEFGALNYFVARTITESPIKYKNPKVSRNIVPFEMQINWNSPVVLCEGAFDAIAIKRNAIPLLGKQIPEKLLKKIVSSSVSQVYVALDNDAIKDALNHCEKLLNYGKQVFLLNLEDKDPSEMGFEKFTQLLHEATPLTFRQIMELKFTL